MASSSRGTPARKTAATRKILKPSSRATVEYETWSPDQAAEALKRNKVNRNKREHRIATYARMMFDGKWGKISGSIVFDEDGNLIDGQHRLHAQVEAGVDITWLVTRNASKEDIKNIDTGIPRSAADYLHFMADEQNVQVMAGTARLCMKYEGDKLGSTRYQPAPGEIVDWVSEHREIRHSVDMGLRFYNKAVSRISPSVMGGAHWVIAQANDIGTADEFLYRMMYLTNEKDGSPIIALMKKVNDAREKRHYIQPRDMLSLVIKVWNYDAKGESVYKLNLYQKGQYKRPVPVVKGEPSDEDVTSESVRTTDEDAAESA